MILIHIWYAVLFNTCNHANVLIACIDMKFYRSDPTENDSVEGLRPNARGPGLVTFGVSVKCVIDSSHRLLHITEYIWFQH